MADMYERLRERLDAMATGYPATPGGVEIRILKQLFSEEDAELFLSMAQQPETIEEIASRLGSAPAVLEAKTQGYGQKRAHLPAGGRGYCPVQPGPLHRGDL